MENFTGELECLKSSFDSSEFQFIISNKTPVLKFFLQNNVSVTFEIPPAYPEIPPLISISAELTNTERLLFEHELRNLASKSIGYPMILDLVIKLQQVTEDYYEKKQSESQTSAGIKKEELTNTERLLFEHELRNLASKSIGYPMILDLVIKLQQVTEDYYEKKQSESQTSAGIKKEEIPYLAVILIDHMRQKKKYCSTLTSWAIELGILGCLMFCQRWIFLLLQGSKKQVKEFITRHRTVCIDVDSAGKPCKEKMAKTLFEGSSFGNFSDFSIKEMSSTKDVEAFFENANIISIYRDIIQPLLTKHKSSQ